MHAQCYEGVEIKLKEFNFKVMHGILHFDNTNEIQIGYLSHQLSFIGYASN